MDRLERDERAMGEAPCGEPPLFDLEQWLSAGSPRHATLRLRGDADLTGHYGELVALARIVIEFPTFMDGRGFSHARKLRALGFDGELIAAGEVLADQWQFLQRCGFNAMENAQSEQAASTLPRFSEAYQGDERQPLPLFRRSQG